MEGETSTQRQEQVQSGGGGGLVGLPVVYLADACASARLVPDEGVWTMT